MAAYLCPLMSKSKNQTSPEQAPKNEWFKDWFNSPYYYLLYKNRDEQEAQKFIDRLLDHLRPAPGALVLDLACGKGRYSRYLAEKGLTVTGVDIAAESIAFAQQFENERLSFFMHDMRLPFRINYFDFIFNFFTSFGYFETEKDHLKTIRDIGKGLRPNGKFVLDFFNSKKVIQHLKAKEIKRVDDVTFYIRRSVDKEGYIVKDISFEVKRKRYQFTERVRAFTLEDFERLFGLAGMKIAETFGDYQLNGFDEVNSDRLILVGCKEGC